MFIPCDSDGNVFEEPNKYKNWTNFDYSGTDIGFEDEKLCREYQQAKENVIFEGFKVIDKGNFYFLEIEDTIIWHRVINKHTKATIEDLLKFPVVTLTDNAIKKYKL